MLSILFGRDVYMCTALSLWDGGQAMSLYFTLVSPLPGFSTAYHTIIAVSASPWGTKHMCGGTWASRSHSSLHRIFLWLYESMLPIVRPGWWMDGRWPFCPGRLALLKRNPISCFDVLSGRYVLTCWFHFLCGCLHLAFRFKCLEP